MKVVCVRGKGIPSSEQLREIINVVNLSKKKDEKVKDFKDRIGEVLNDVNTDKPIVIYIGSDNLVPGYLKKNNISFMLMMRLSDYLVKDELKKESIMKDYKKADYGLLMSKRKGVRPCLDDYISNIFTYTGHKSEYEKVKVEVNYD